MDLWVFDNDGTLYDDFNVGEKFMKILSKYVSHLFGVSIDQATEYVVRLKEKWQTDFSIIALMKEHGINFAEIIENTYLKIQLDECNITAPDTLRLGILESINSRKVVFTNNPSVFARRVLGYVGLEGCFTDFIGMEETGFCGKPDLRAYRVVEDRHKECDRIIFCDDSLKNLETARSLGWTTIWCKPKNIDTKIEGGNIVISSFKELEAISQGKLSK